MSLPTWQTHGCHLLDIHVLHVWPRERNADLTGQVARSKVCVCRVSEAKGRFGIVEVPLKNL